MNKNDALFSADTQLSERLLIGSAAALAIGSIALLVVCVAIGTQVVRPADSLTLRVDITAALLIALAATVSAVVQSFAGRYLSDETYRVQFLAFASATAVGASLSAAAAGPLLLVVGWSVAGYSLYRLVALDGRAEPAARAVRTTRRSELASAGSLLLAAVIALASGSGDFASMSADDFSPALAAICCLLVLVALIARSAQLPLGGWLQNSLTAPTPVSALMHAGLVNAGALLLIRWEPVFFSQLWAVLLVFALAAVTIVIATGAMIARPDVKGSLALSTRAQMGFMLVQCALGAFAGALFHLISHGMYKAALFLGAGRVIDQERDRMAAPPARQGAGQAPVAAQMFVSATVPLVAIFGAVAIFSPELLASPGKLALFIFAWSTAAQALWWWLRLRKPSFAGAIGACISVGVAAAAYVAAFAAFDGLVGGGLPDPAAAAPAWLVVPLFTVLAGATFARWLAEAELLGEPREGGRAERLYAAAYARALDFGHVVNSSPRTARRHEPALEVRA